MPQEWNAGSTSGPMRAGRLEAGVEVEPQLGQHRQVGTEARRRGDVVHALESDARRRRCRPTTVTDRPSAASRSSRVEKPTDVLDGPRRDEVGAGRMPSRPRSGSWSAVPPPKTRRALVPLIAQTTRVPGTSRASWVRVTRVFAAEWPIPTTSVVRPANRPRSAPRTSGSGPTRNPAPGPLLPQRRQPGGAERVGLPPRAGGVDDGPGAQVLDGAVSAAGRARRRGARRGRGCGSGPGRRARPPRPGRRAAPRRRGPRPAAGGSARRSPPRWATGVPRGGSSRTAPGASPRSASTMYCHGVKVRMWPHCVIALPTPSPASRTMAGRPRSARCAAAARPTGPAPMTTTGSWPSWGAAAVRGGGGGGGSGHAGSSEWDGPMGRAGGTPFVVSTFIKAELRHRGSISSTSIEFL